MSERSSATPRETLPVSTTSSTTGGRATAMSSATSATRPYDFEPCSELAAAETKCRRAPLPEPSSRRRSDGDGCRRADEREQGVVDLVGVCPGDRVRAALDHHELQS